jgi:hemerythrin superfamily protein
MATRKQESKTAKTGEGGMDAVQLLKQDHDTVAKMFEEFESGDADRKFELAAQICHALTVHATIEEEIFYPQVREAIDAEGMMLEAEIEHDSIKQLIERVQDGEIDEIQLAAMIKVMQEYVTHHVNEEQRKIFPRAKRAGLDLVALGRELLERKTELEGELADEAGQHDTDSEDESAGTGGRRSRGGMAASERSDEEGDEQ